MYTNVLIAVFNRLEFGNFFLISRFTLVLKFRNYSTIILHCASLPPPPLKRKIKI